MEKTEVILHGPSEPEISAQKSKIWTNRIIILYSALAILQLILSLLNYDNVVWAADWESSKQIAEGIPMYDQTGFVTRGPSIVWLPPDHFPVYFYFMAFLILLFGPNQIIARAITWVFVIVTSHLLIKLIQPINERELLVIIVLYFLNPMLSIVNYIGKFDQIAIFLLIWGIYLTLRKYYFSGGFVLGIGIMTKFFPVFAVVAGGIYFLRKKEIQNLIKFSVGSLISSVPIFVYFYATYGDKFTKVILFQINRLTPSLSIWYYIIPKNIEGIEIVKWQIGFFLIIALLLFLYPIDLGSNYYLMSTAVLISSYLVTTRQFYSSYAIFLQIPMIPVLIQLLRANRNKLFILGIINLPFYYIGTTLCDDRCYPNVFPMTSYSYFGLFLVFFSTLFTIIYYFILYPNLSNFSKDEVKLLI